MIYLYIVFLLTLAIIFLFSSKTFSPIPYFPSNKKDLPLIIKALNLKNNQVIVDLGAGDGIVIFEAAKKAYEKELNTQFIAVEINPILILIMLFKKLFHPNKKNIKIVFDNIFKYDPSRSKFYVPRYTFYVYLSPWFLNQVLKNIKSQIKKFEVVSYMYEVKNLKNKEKIIQGINKIYTYKIN